MAMGEHLTCDMQLLLSDLRLQVDATPLLSMVHAAQTGHVDDTLFVHVHVTGCKREGRGEDGVHELRWLPFPQCWGV